jgi:hypothetical protein
MSKGTRHVLVVVGLFLAGASALGAQKSNPFVGRWALTIPGGDAGWLGVVEKDGNLSASILWGGGSVVPVTAVKMEGDKLVLTRVEESGRGEKKIRSTETITAKVDGNNLKFTTVTKRSNGSEGKPQDFTGKRIPPLPGKPDLAKVKFGKPVVLFDGKSLDGWKLTDPGAKSGWSIENGVLVNNPVQPDPNKHISYSNLRTVAEFEDFNLKLEVNVGKGENSGVYLRGIYEVQVCDSFGKPLDSHNMGGVYSRITPTESAEKAPGEWQTMDLTLVDRHVTVVLNGKKIIDNEPVLGCTGGALWSDEFKPGPIYLQGDHTGIKYRNIVIAPVVK